MTPAARPADIARDAAAPRSNDRQFASTLDRGLRVLACFSGSAQELGNADIASATGLPKPTVSRLTYTLVQLGYLRRRPDSARFELGPAVLSLGYPVLAGLLRFRRLAVPHMAELARAINGTVAVAVRDRMQMVSIENVTELDVLHRKPGTGLTIHFAVSTLGLAWMAGALPHERERAWRELAHAQPASLEAMRVEFDDALQRYRRDGYIARHGMNRSDTTVISAPLPRMPGDELLVMSCALNAPAAQADRLAAAAGQKLLQALRAIGLSLNAR